jgi:uncharacterized protein YutE (UPF0331/DUF86 family)
MPQGDMWHKKLIDTMASATIIRPAVISPELLESLKELMNFRHFFRHAYSFTVQWEKLLPLIEKIGSVFEMFEKEIRAFIETCG